MNREYNFDLKFSMPQVVELTTPVTASLPCYLTSVDFTVTDDVSEYYIETPSVRVKIYSVDISVAPAECMPAPA